MVFQPEKMFSTSRRIILTVFDTLWAILVCLALKNIFFSIFSKKKFKKFKIYHFFFDCNGEINQIYRETIRKNIYHRKIILVEIKSPQNSKKLNIFLFLLFFL